MKHSWLELANGTAKCRKCPAVRVSVVKVVRTRNVIECDLGLPDNEDGPQVRVEQDLGAAVKVTGAHLSKCGRPAKDAGWWS